jgi:polyisoprenyl-phosphate glycosyltransferase
MSRDGSTFAGPADPVVPAAIRVRRRLGWSTVTGSLTSGLSPPRFSLVIPVYRNQATLAAAVDRCSTLAAALDGPLEVVFVVDGSPDGSVVLLRRLLQENRGFSAQLIVLSRNFGAFSALKVGLAAAEGELVSVMAADLQEPVSLIEDLYAALASGEHDVALGVRASRADPAFTRFTSRVYWALYRRFVQREMPKAGVDIFACTREVSDQLVRLDESHTSIVGLLLWLGYRSVEIPYDRQYRAHGTSGWTLRRRIRYFLDSVFSFSDLPVLIITTVGVAGVVISVLAALVVFVGYLTGSVHSAGYTPLMLAITFASSSILLALGIIGSYVWRTYENTKGRPGAIPMSHERFPPG